MSINPTITAFLEQSDICETMGSPFTGNLCRSFVVLLDETTKIGALCLNWKGNPAGSADNVPLRLCGGLHALVLSGQGDALAEYYPPNAPEVPPASVLKNVLQTHEKFLLDWMKSPPQTNEVARSAIIWPALMTIADQTSLPLRLLEVGASGGLNLQAQRFAYELGEIYCGAENSVLCLVPQWSGKDPVDADVFVHSAAGCDLNPLNPSDEWDALRLRSYVWPDQIERNQRMNAALTIAQNFPITVEKMDALEWLKRELAVPAEGCCTVIYSTVAWQYLPEEAKAKGEKIIAEAGQRADKKNSPLAWLRVEADASAESGAGIQLIMWPDNKEFMLGRADFHGRWIDWRGI